MRRALGTLLALVLAMHPASAQDTSTTSRTANSSERLERLRREINLLKLTGADGRVPSADSFTVGSRTIQAKEVHTGSVGVTDGDLHVAGKIDGDAIVFDGDIILEKSGEITGDAMSVGGRVIVGEGRVDGERRTLTGPLQFSTQSQTSPPMGTMQTLKLVIGCFAILFVIGVGVLMFAEGNLDGVVIALERSVTKAFWLGLLGQLLLMPALLLLLVGLTLTFLGILLIPFAIVSYVIAAAGVITLGFLAAARLTGSAVTRRISAPRTMNLRALMVGITMFTLLWLVAASFTWHPLVGAILRGVAAIVTWVALTVGLGGAIASRAGTQRPGARSAPHPAARDDLSWQTPTPVTGVAAARRPQSPTPRNMS
jgi:hypothetical protein